MSETDSPAGAPATPAPVETEPQLGAAGEKALEWRTLLLSGKRSDDAVDMTRTTDKRRGTRTRASIGAVT